ncbi:MAG TPA: hypothetical protein VF720_10635, partial [Candidatus Eisenbacteria bacterium]
STRATPAILLLAGWILTPALATAASWSEQGDAGDLPATAQITAGAGGLTQITGSLPSDADIDMYCFRVTDRASFFAFRICAGIAEPDLWLFDQNGAGIELNDGCMFSQTNLSAGFVPTNGLYYLAVSLSDRDARNAGGQIIWNSPSQSAPRAPDGPGAPGPLVSWGGSAFPLGPVTYSIQLNGATFCDIPVPAEPASWGTVKSRFVDP